MLRSQALRVVATLVVVVACWIAAKALHLAPTRPRPPWNGITIVSQANGEDALLTRALIDAIDEGVSPIFGADVIGAFMRHVHGELSQRKAARLCLRMIVEGVAAANAALWSPRDAVRLMIALQRELDADGGAAFPHLQRVIALVRGGSTAGEVLTPDGRLSVPTSRPF
jgi:hypothetical protein